MSTSYPYFLATALGLENVAAKEARKLGLTVLKTVGGGVEMRGDWPDIWRANLWMRTVNRVLVRVGSFQARHLSQLDKRSAQLPWEDFLKPNTPVKISAVCKKSKIYHSGAAIQRVAQALERRLSVQISDKAAIEVVIRLENDRCMISLDSSGTLLHRRGFRQAIGKAPLRETLAAGILHLCDYDGQYPVLDPMCGSGTFLLEAAEIALQYAPGRARSFAFEKFAHFDAAQWQSMRNSSKDAIQSKENLQFFGYDRDAGAIQQSQQNAVRAGVDSWISFAEQPIQALRAPDIEKGLLIVNPPYGTRIGNIKQLTRLYAALGTQIKTHFNGWKVGIVTTENNLAQATGLTLRKTKKPIPNGALRIYLYQT